MGFDSPQLHIVSIHSFQAEGDVFRHSTVDTNSMFQSTPSKRKETAIMHKYILLYSHLFVQNALF